MFCFICLSSPLWVTEIWYNWVKQKNVGEGRRGVCGSWLLQAELVLNDVGLYWDFRQGIVRFIFTRKYLHVWVTFRSDLMLSVILTAYNFVKWGSVRVLAFLEDHINPCTPMGEMLLTFSMSWVKANAYCHIWTHSLHVKKNWNLNNIQITSNCTEYKYHKQVFSSGIHCS